MKKSEIKNGAVVELRNGNRYLKVDDTLLNLNMSGGFISLEEYNDLNDKDGIIRYDIVKVLNPETNILYKNVCNLALSHLKDDPIKWSWERKEPKLTSEEKEFLQKVFNALKYPILYIKFLNEYVYMVVDDDDENNDNLFYLPRYSSLKYEFKGVEKGKTYTPKELGLSSQ